MRRALAAFLDLIAVVGLVWVAALAILLIGLPFAAIIRALAAVFRLVMR